MGMNWGLKTGRGSDGNYPLRLYPFLDAFAVTYLHITLQKHSLERGGDKVGG